MIDFNKPVKPHTPIRIAAEIIAGFTMFVIIIELIKCY